MFGLDRVYEVIRNNARVSAYSIQEKLIAALEEFRGAKNREDDITMVVLKVE